jgi:hypothetical protein
MRGGGGIVSFLVAGGLERARRLIDCVEMLSHTANLGDLAHNHYASGFYNAFKAYRRRAAGGWNLSWPVARFCGIGTQLRHHCRSGCRSEQDRLTEE